MQITHCWITITNNLLNTKNIITDSDTSKDKVIQRTNFKRVETKYFEGNIDIFSRRPKSTLYILSHD